MKPISIKLRLSLLVSLLTLAIILVVCIAAYVETEESLLNSVDKTLQVTGEAIVATLREEDESPEARQADFRSIMGDPNSGDSGWCRIWPEGSEKELFSSGLPNYPRRALWLELLPKERPEVDQTSFFSTTAVIDQNRELPFRMVWIRSVCEQQVVNVLVGRSSYHVSHELAEFYQFLLIIGASLTLIAFLAVPFLVSWGLSPIAWVSSRLQTITHRSLGQEAISATETAPELRPFLVALEEMLSRLDKAMRQQEQFIADAAHELRTPVAVIKSTLQTTRLQCRTTGEYEQDIDETLEDIERLERLIEQLLSLARFEGIAESFKSGKVRLDALLDDIVGIFEARATQQGGQIVLSEATCTWVRGDEIGLRQLFSNLLENALQHGPATGTVRVTLQDGPDEKVTVTVHDEGGQISPEALPHLFDRFFRVDSSRSHASGGSGLGLAIAREIARKHDGDITITSEPKTGTSAIVHLPRL